MQSLRTKISLKVFSYLSRSLYLNKFQNNTTQYVAICKAFFKLIVNYDINYDIWLNLNAVARFPESLFSLNNFPEDISQPKSSRMFVN